MKKLVCALSLFLTVQLAQAQFCFKTATAYTVGTGTQNSTSVKIADFNANGKPDLITANSFTSNPGYTILLDYDQSTATFTSTTNHTLTTGYSTLDVVTADFDGDGKTDWITVNSGTANNLILFQGNGAGGFGSTYTFSPGSGPRAAIAVDFNGDSKPDLAVINASSQSMSILLNTSSGIGSFSFAAAVAYTSNLNTPYALINGDFNHDGNMDVAVSNNVSGGNGLVVFSNNGAGVFSSFATGTIGSNPNGITSSDFNGDGFLDLVLALSSSGGIAVFLNNAGSGFSNAATYPTAANYCYDVTSGDFNKDGKVDLATTGYGTSNGVFFMAGNGTGSFGSAQSFFSGQLKSIGRYDFNADGNMDIVVADYFNKAADILLNAKPVISGLTTICSGNSTTLTASGSTTYTWNTGNTSTSVILSPSVSTTYTVTGSVGTCTSSSTALILVNATPTITVSGANTLCAGSFATLTASGANTYTWNPGSTTGFTISINPATTTVYTVTGTSAGCLSSYNYTVTVNPTPVINVIPSSAICMGQTLTFTNSTTNAISYNWSGPNGFTSTLQNPSPIANLTSANSGVYNLSATSSASCLSTYWLNINVNALPTLTVNNAVICTGSTCNLFATGANTYTWSPSSGLSSANNATVTAFPTNSTIYIVTGTDANGCINTVTSTVIVNPAPSVSVNSPSVCSGSMVTLTSTVTSGTAPYSYLWQGGVNTYSTVVTTTITTLYNLIVTDANGCTGNSMSNVTVINNEDIGGVVTDTSTNSGQHLISSGVVYLYKQQAPPLAALAIDSVFINSGNYNFSQVPAGSYFIKAVATSTLYAGAIPTYFPKAFLCDSSTAVTQVGCTGNTNGGINIRMLELSGQTGTGIISGTVTADASFSGRYASGGHNAVMGSPLKGIDVKLGKNPGGGCAARTTADTSGFYQFNNVPNGAYSIYVDIPNYGMVTILTTSISASNPQSVNNNYCVDSTAINVCSTVGIAKVSSNNYQVKVYPNPSAGIFNIELNEHANMSIEIYSIIGQKIYSENIQNNIQQVNINSLTEGMYLIRVLKNNRVVYQTKISKL